MKKKFLCPSCESSSLGRVDSLPTKILDLEESTYRVLKCNCGLRYLWPRVENEQLTELYNVDYFSGESADTTPDDYGNTVKTRHNKFKSCIEGLKFYLSSTKQDISGANFLDIGAGTGDMVFLAKSAGFNATGLEFSSFARQKALENFGINLSSRDISEIENDQYHIIHTNHVFEHFNHPLKELKHIYDGLKTEGLLYIEIPMQFHIIEKFKHLFGNDKMSYNLHSIHHPFFYTEKSLCDILLKCGFVVIESKTLTRSDNGSKLKSIFWKIAGMFGVGNIIEVYAKKI